MTNEPNKAVQDLLEKNLKEPSKSRAEYLKKHDVCGTEEGIPLDMDYDVLRGEANYALLNALLGD